VSLLLPPYTTGTVSVAAGATTITGVSTLWTDSSAQEGDLFVHAASGLCVLIRARVDGGHLTIDAWPGSTLSGAAYRIEKISPLRYAWGTAQATSQKLLDTLDGVTIYNVTGAAPDDSLGEEGQLALKFNGGVVQAWEKQSGVWVSQGIILGLAYAGEWNSATPYPASIRVSENGSSYASKQASTNVRPSTDTGFVYWDKIGAQGAPGANGATFTSGSSVPTGGADGDFYLRDTNGDIYRKISGIWTVIFNTKGATGATPAIAGTSSSAATVGTGPKIFQTQAGLAIVANQRYGVTNVAGDRAMVGRVTSYVGTTLTIDVDYVKGVGADSSWTLAIAGETGPEGGTGVSGPRGDGGAPGIQGPVGPASTVPGPQGPVGAGLTWNASGTLAQRVTYDGQTTGYAFLQTDSAPAKLWIKASNTSADWAGPFYQGGTAAVGDWGLITDSVIDMYDYGSIAA
jgi:hypothetical protein